MDSLGPSPPLEWASVPPPLVFLIMDKLFDPIDHIRFAAVCKEWRVRAKDYNHTRQRWRNKVPPMLMIPTPTESKEKRALYSVAEDKIYNVELPYDSKKFKCCSCSHGWLAMLDLPHQDHWTITLVNPFEKAEAPIRLPPLYFVNQVGQGGIPKITLSEDPTLNPGNYAVIAIHGDTCQLSVTVGGQGSWTHYSDQIIRSRGLLYLYDAIFYRSRVYAMAIGGTLMSWDANRGQLDYVKGLLSDRREDMGIFNLEDQSYTQQYNLDDLRMNVTEPQWIVPPINGLC